jgi:hypothetical protein
VVTVAEEHTAYVASLEAQRVRAHLAAWGPLHDVCGAVWLPSVHDVRITTCALPPFHNGAHGAPGGVQWA